MKLFISISTKPDTSRGFVTTFDGKQVLYLLDKAIGDRVSFKADGKQRTGKIIRIDGKTKNITNAVKNVSVLDETETFTNDEGDEVPISWTLHVSQFKLLKPVPTI